MTEKKYFLSHSGADRDEAKCLAERLIDLGIAVWCDVLPGNLEPGQWWVSDLEEDPEDCAGYLVLIGERAVSGWVEAELQYALNRNAREESLLVLPILMAGAKIDSLPPLLQRFQAFKLQASARELSEELLLTLSRTLESEDASVRSVSTSRGWKPTRCDKYSGPDSHGHLCLARIEPGCKRSA